MKDNLFAAVTPAKEELPIGITADETVHVEGHAVSVHSVTTHDRPSKEGLANRHPSSELRRRRDLRTSICVA